MSVREWLLWAALGCGVALGGCSAGGKPAPGELPRGQGGAAGSMPSGTGDIVTQPGNAGAGGSGGSPAIPIPTGSTPQGTKLPFAGYDPTVTFDWPQATTTSGTCKAGRYHGSFIGIYSPSITVFPAPIPVAGDIDLTLTQSSTGEFFDITGGKVSGVADGLFPFSADVQGTLDCAAGKLVNGFLSKGVYIVGVLPYAFEGPLTGNYDKLTQSFTNDDWTVGEPTWTTPRPIYGGSGTWQATWTGP